MRLRVASLAFLLGSLSTGVAWLSLQPSLVRLLSSVYRLAAPGTLEAEAASRVRELLPFYLALDLVVVTAVCFAVLHLVVARPLRQAEASIDQLARHDLHLPLTPSGGPLLARFQRALKRMADSLHQEQALTQRQVSELEAANARLSRAQIELVASERLATVGRLSAGVAHEVGNPLAGILGYLSLARSRGVTPAAGEMLDRIDAEVQRIDGIVKGLLDLGRPARGNPAPVEVEAIAHNCIKLLSAGPDFAGIDVQVQVEAGAVARAESGPLSQVMLNLLLNASQAMGGKGAIRVRARRQDERIILEVEDTGPGIPQEVLPQLFEPFFTTRAAGKGSGLGLAVCRHLLSTMGGSLQAANASGGGACFTVSLPAAG